MSIQERILQYLDYKIITPYKFCKDLKFSMGYLDKRGAIGTDKYLKIIEYYKDINPEWLLTGKGEMLKNAGYTNKETKTTVKEPKTAYIRKEKETGKGIPLISIEAMAGFGSGDIQVMNYDSELYNIPEFTELNVDFMIRVKGSSMYPKYSSGDIVACKKLPLTDLFFQWNKVYVLDTTQGALIKRIKKGSDSEHVLIVSENSNYDPFELHLSQIYAVAIVCGVIRLE
ncbi:MAG: helix-turn-helix transcriptional regulator [Apibacter sp.]|nr:helix-turn-helix transcriptional regulator [Apibacter sp.]